MNTTAGRRNALQGFVSDATIAFKRLMAYECFELDVDGGVAHLKLCAPGAAQRHDRGVLEGIAARSCADLPEANALVLVFRPGRISVAGWMFRFFKGRFF